MSDTPTEPTSLRLYDRIRDLERELAEAKAQLDAVAQEVAEVKTKWPREYEKQNEALTAERDAALARASSLRSQLDAAREEITNCAEACAAIVHIIDKEDFQKDELWIPTIRAHANVSETDLRAALAAASRQP